MIIFGDESARPRLLKLANRMTSSRFSTQTASIFLMLCIKISTAICVIQIHQNSPQDWWFSKWRLKRVLPAVLQVLLISTLNFPLLINSHTQRWIIQVSVFWFQFYQCDTIEWRMGTHGWLIRQLNLNNKEERDNIVTLKTSTFLLPHKNWKLIRDLITYTDYFYWIQVQSFLK